MNFKQWRYIRRRAIGKIFKRTCHSSKVGDLTIDCVLFRMSLWYKWRNPSICTKFNMLFWSNIVPLLGNFLPLIVEFIYSSLIANNAFGTWSPTHLMLLPQKAVVGVHEGCESLFLQNSYSNKAKQFNLTKPGGVWWVIGFFYFQQFLRMTMMKDNQSFFVQRSYVQS